MHATAIDKQKAVRVLEYEIEKQEQALAALGQQIDQASARGDTSTIAELGTQFEELQTELEKLLNDWSHQFEGDDHAPTEHGKRW